MTSTTTSTAKNNRHLNQAKFISGTSAVPLKGQTKNLVLLQNSNTHMFRVLMVMMMMGDRVFFWLVITGCRLKRH
ncbi:hypothetical protein TYRP_003184 [Tyrophagus putrescentiae]|nr:hypothetical protein TYRP_003184 [Tyrophagus putrescentiae]